MAIRLMSTTYRNSEFVELLRSFASNRVMKLEDELKCIVIVDDTPPTNRVHLLGNHTIIWLSILDYHPSTDRSLLFDVDLLQYTYL